MGLELEDVKVMIPLFPLRGGDVFFENSIKSVVVGRPSTVATVKAALANDGQVAVFTLSNATESTPILKDFFTTGVRAEVVSMRELEPGKYAVTLSGISLIRLVKVHCIDNDVLMADVHPHSISPLSAENSELVDDVMKALGFFCDNVGLPPSTVRLVELSVRSDVNPAHEVANRLVGAVVSYVRLSDENQPFSTEQQLKLLEAPSVEKQLRYLIQLLKSDEVRNQLVPGYAERISIHIERASEYIPPINNSLEEFAARLNQGCDQKYFDVKGNTRSAPGQPSLFGYLDLVVYGPNRTVLEQSPYVLKVLAACLLDNGEPVLARFDGFDVSLTIEQAGKVYFLYYKSPSLFEKGKMLKGAIGFADPIGSIERASEDSLRYKPNQSDEWTTFVKPSISDLHVDPWDAEQIKGIDTSFGKMFSASRGSADLKASDNGIVFHTEEALISSVETAISKSSNPHAHEMKRLADMAIQGDSRALVATLSDFNEPPPAFLLNMGEFAAAFLYYLAAQFRGSDEHSHQLKMSLLNYGDRFTVPLATDERGSRVRGTELPKSRIIDRLAREHCSFVLEKALSAFERGDFKESAELYGSAGATQYFPEALLGRGAALDRQGKFEEAIQSTRDFIARVATLPKDAYQREDLPKAYINLATSLYSLGRLTAARKEIAKAVKLDPSDEHALELRDLLDATDEKFRPTKAPLPAEGTSIESATEKFESVVLDLRCTLSRRKKAVSEFANFLKGCTLSQEQEIEVREICRTARARGTVQRENMKGELDSGYIEGVNCDAVIAALEINTPFFISSLGIVLDFGDALNEIDEQFVYAYFLNKILFASKSLFSIVSIEDDGRTLDSGELKAALGKSRKLSEFAEASSSGNLDQLLNDPSKMPWEFFRILARLPMKYGKSAFVFFGGHDMDRHLTIDAYCVKESAEEELGDVLAKLFGASDISFRGGPKSGHNPISTDSEAIENLTLSIDSETHLHPED